MAGAAGVPAKFLVFLLFQVSGWVEWKSCDALGTFGFDIHHVFSNKVREIVGVDGLLPETNTAEYYRLMVDRDSWFRGRRLASNNNQPTVSFAAGNRTFHLPLLGFLHYANVSVGNPARWFLVAMDTSSDLFWLPCNCLGCARTLRGRNGIINLNLYSPNGSSTSSMVPCNSDKCGQADQCASPNSDCPFQLQYNDNDATSGTLVDDRLHLITEDEASELVEAPITLGCADIQTGRFLLNSAVNGLMGLGQGNLSVPSALANANISSNSFSMCFGAQLTGRISFGDKGNINQSETALNPDNVNYNVTITQVIVGGQNASLEFAAAFESGVAFSSLMDPTYTFLTQSMNIRMEGERRLPASSDLPFEFCYALSPGQTVIRYPPVELGMRGGGVYAVKKPFVFLSSNGTLYGYCLGVVKNNDTNIIGQNFMKGYRLVFDRERLILGWKESDCYDDSESDSTTVSPPTRPSLPPSESPSASLSPPSTPANAPSPLQTFNPSVGSATPPSFSMTLKPAPYGFLLAFAPIFVFLI